MPISEWGNKGIRRVPSVFEIDDATRAAIAELDTTTGQQARAAVVRRAIALARAAASKSKD